MFKRTGPGKVTVDSKYLSMGALKALLFNFDIDGDTPKQEHVEFFLKTVFPRLEANRGKAWMQGTASRSGNEQHNLDLSERRVRNVAEVLKGKGVHPIQLSVIGVGEAQAEAARHAYEDEADRGVALLVLRVVRLPQKVPAPPPPVSDKFKIRMLGGISGQIGIIQGESLYFQIWDEGHKRSAIYGYSGGSLFKSIGGRVSVTVRGPWNKFTTTSPIRVSQFEGPAQFTTGGGAWWTWNYLTMMGVPDGVATVPRVLSIETGFTFGLGISSGSGELILIDEGPFNGD